jgi:F0F1-type ATP synthase assembly protein I
MKETAISHKTGVQISSTLGAVILGILVGVLAGGYVTSSEYLLLVGVLAVLVLPAMIMVSGEHEAADTVVMLAVDTCLDRLEEQREQQATEKGN